MSNKRPYEIKPYTVRKAEKLKVDVFPSHRGNYKIDVYDIKTGEYLCSVGDRRYQDYPTYIETEGLDYAEKRRKLYHIRHYKEGENYGSKGYFALHLLW